MEVNFQDMFTGESLVDDTLDVNDVEIDVAINDSSDEGYLTAVVEAYSTQESISCDREIAMLNLDDKYKNIELTGEAAAMHQEALAILGSTYMMTGEGLVDGVKSVLKAIEVYARKFIAFVGKWIAKAGTLFGSFESTRKECLAAVEAANEKTEIDLTQSWVNKITEFFGANAKGKSSEGKAILTFNKDLLKSVENIEGLVAAGDLTVKNTMANGKGTPNTISGLARSFSGTDAISKFIETNGKDGSEVRLTLTTGVRGTMWATAVAVDKDGVVTSSKLFQLVFKYKSMAYKVGKTTLGELNVDLPKLKEVLEKDGKSRRKDIDVCYTTLKEVLNLGLEEAKKAKNAKDAATAKQSGIVGSKYYFKAMFMVNSNFKDAIRVGKMIKKGKTSGDDDDKEK